MQVTAKATEARVSLIHSIVLCKVLKNKKVSTAKKFLEDLISKKINLNGKYYSKASEKFLEVLNSAEANAKQKNLDPEKLFIKIIKADKARKFLKPASKAKFRGREAKMTNIQIVLEAR